MVAAQECTTRQTRCRSQPTRCWSSTAPSGTRRCSSSSAPWSPPASSARAGPPPGSDSFLPQPRPLVIPQGKARCALLMAGKHVLLLDRDASFMDVCCSSTGYTVSSGLFGVRRRPIQAPAVPAARPPLSFLVGYLCIAYVAGYCVLPVDVRLVLKNQVLRQLCSHMASCGDSARVGAPSLMLLSNPAPTAMPTAVIGVAARPTIDPEATYPVIYLPRCGLTQGVCRLEIYVSDTRTHTLSLSPSLEHPAIPRVRGTHQPLR